MKKLLLVALATTMCFAVANAQQQLSTQQNTQPEPQQESQREKGTKTKNNYDILPVKGDFAIGVAANPFLNFATGLLAGGQQAPVFDGIGGRIFGKYFIRNNQAIRFGLDLGIGGGTDKNKIADDSNTDPQAIDPHKFDQRTINNSRFNIFGGYEWRRGYGRLQGVFGVQGGLNFLVQSTSYKWANEMTVDHPAPTTSNVWPGAGMNAGSRVLKVVGPGSFGFNMMGFVGAEFFFARKMSIGAELGLGFDVNTILKTKTTSESVRNGAVEQHTIVGNNIGATRWGFNTLLQGNLFLMFHF